MNAKTLKATKGSIAKWEAIYAGTGVDKGCDNCPLCHLFLYPDSCNRCPVFLKTRQELCLDTPYVQWRHSTGGEYRATAKTPAQKRAALAEINFLKSLLPRKAK